MSGFFSDEVAGGWLVKKGKLNAGWKERFVVLHGNGELCYYDPKKGSKAAGEGRGEPKGRVRMATVTDVQVRRNPRATTSLRSAMKKKESAGSTKSRVGGLGALSTRLKGGHGSEPSYLMELVAPGRQFIFGAQDKAALDQWLPLLRWVSAMEHARKQRQAQSGAGDGFTVSGALSQLDKSVSEGVASVKKQVGVGAALASVKGF